MERHLLDCGANVFLDQGCIEIGDEFENVILEELRDSQELAVLMTPWAIEHSHYVWMEIGAAWGLGIRIVFILHGISFEELNQHRNMPVLVKKNNCININDLPTYFEQLEHRIKK